MIQRVGRDDSAQLMQTVRKRLLHLLRLRQAKYLLVALYRIGRVQFFNLFDDLTHHLRTRFFCDS